MYLFPRSAENVYTVLQGVEAAANLVVLLGALLFFLVRIAAGLSQRIWQKITIVRYITPHTADPTGATPTSSGTS